MHQSKANFWIIVKAYSWQSLNILLIKYKPTFLLNLLINKKKVILNSGAANRPVLWNVSIAASLLVQDGLASKSAGRDKRTSMLSWTPCQLTNLYAECRYFLWFVLAGRWNTCVLLPTHPTPPSVHNGYAGWQHFKMKCDKKYKSRHSSSSIINWRELEKLY